MPAKRKATQTTGRAARKPKKSEAPKKETKGSVAAPEREIVDIDQAIELLKTSRSTFYRWLRSGSIKGMKVGRQWRFYKDDIELFMKGEEPRIELTADIKPLIRRLSKLVEECGAQDVAPPDTTEIAHAVSLMIRLGEAMHSSDIHLEPHSRPGTEKGIAALRYRVDGVLHPIAEIDLRLLPAIIEQWKKLAACDTHEKRKPQYGRIAVELDDIGKLLDVRVSFLPAVLGESLTARVLDPDVAASLELDRIDFSAEVKEKYVQAIHRPWGLIIVTGPTGCGKTTSLYAGLNHISGPDRKIITIEDPVEYLLPWCLQIALNPGAGVTFPSAIVGALRSAPNSIMVGEIRDRETLDLCISCALTGHLVLTVLHTRNSVSALQRMADVGAEPFRIADATKLILAQRLVRTLCPDCSKKETPRASFLKRAQEVAAAGGLDWKSLPKDFRGPGGCGRCVNTGFKGRTIIAEALEITSTVYEALERGASAEELEAAAVKDGMTTFPADGIRRAANGETSLEEVMRVVGER